MGCGASKNKAKESDEVVRETAPKQSKTDSKPEEKKEVVAVDGTKTAASAANENKQEIAAATNQIDSPPPPPRLATSTISSEGDDKEEKRVLPTREELLNCMEECRTRLEQVAKERQEKKLPLHTSEDPMLMLIFMGEAMQVGQKYNITTIQDMDAVKQQYKDDDEINDSHAKLKTLLTKHGLPV